MNLRLRTAIVFALLLALVYFLVKIVSIYILIIFFNIVLLYINSVFLFAYLDLKGEKQTTMKKWPSVSIIIPNYNGESTLAKCIESVKALEYPSGKEIIVIDDGSRDGSRAILKKFSGIKHILKKKNMGKAAALNDGIRLARGEVIVTIDSDTFPEKDCLVKMIPCLNGGVAAVTGFVRAFNTKGFVEKLQEIEYLVAFGFFQKILSDINAILVTPGPMSAYKAGVLRDIGGFDEKNITEDMEIAFRLRQNGWRIAACIDAHMYTVVPDNMRSLFRQRTRWYRGKFVNTVKYGGMLFNPKFGEFGLFTFPFSVIVEWCVVMFVFVMVAANIEAVLNYFGALSLVLSAGVSPEYFIPAFFGLNSSFFFYLIGAAFYSVFIYYSHELAGVKLGLARLPEITLFIIVYSIFISAVFFFGFFKEINRSDYSW